MKVPYLFLLNGLGPDRAEALVRITGFMGLNRTCNTFTCTCIVYCNSENMVSH